MIIHPPAVSTAKFTYTDNVFIGEVSELGMDPTRPVFGPVYDDACDEGLTLISHVTGAEVVFVVTHTEYRDGDLLWWDLRAVTKGHKHLTIKLFND